MFRIALPILSLLAFSSVSAGQAEDEKAIVATVQKLFDAMAAKDAIAVRALGLPGAQHVALRPTGVASVVSHEKFAENVGASKDTWLEKIWDPKVMIHGKIATLWAPYDFHRSGQFTHCGIDAVSLDSSRRRMEDRRNYLHGGTDRLRF